MASLKSDCRKFSPNIFNKTKCQNCFRGKDVHSAEALESNRATRKVCLCAYLFVAPGWDFSLPANRNKRWQRRWFVLYDDGELAYSVDECPETVPQAVIDMNCVLEVSDAETITGNDFALAIMLPEKVHFVKGTTKEESKKWFEALSKFSHNTVCSKYKRNATFPGTKTIFTSNSENNFTDWVNKQGESQNSEWKKSIRGNSGLNQAQKTKPSLIMLQSEIDNIPTKDTNTTKSAKPYQNELARSESVGSQLHSDPFGLVRSSLQTSPMTPKSNGKLSYGSTDADISKDLLQKENILHKSSGNCKHHIKSELKNVRKEHSHSDVTPMIPSQLRDKKESDWKKLFTTVDSLDGCVKNCHPNPVYVLMSDVTSGRKYETCEKFFHSEVLHTLRRRSNSGKRSDLQKLTSLWQNQQVSSESLLPKSASVPNAVILNDSLHSPSDTAFSSPYNTITKKKLLGSKFASDKYLPDHVSLERGDPDGCNLDSLTSQCDLNSEETYSLKKGWLVKQDENKWNKHWFVLRNSALAYYTDPIAEDSGTLDGVVDLRKVQSVTEMQSNSGHTFSVTMKDGSRLYLSAVTAKIRNNWIKAILQGAKLKSEDVSKKQNGGFTLPSNALNVIKRNASASSVESEGLPEKIVKNRISDGNRVESPGSLSLPMSPPLARTAISKVKERSRSRSRNSRYNSIEINETPPNSSYLADSDDGATDHSSSSLSHTPILICNEEEKPKVNCVKKPEEMSRSERRRSLRLSATDALPFQDRRKRVLELKDKLQDSSWCVWLDVSKFCKEIGTKLDDIDKVNGDTTCDTSLDKKKEVGHLVTCLMKVEKKLQKVNTELEKAKEDILLSKRDDEVKSSSSRNGGVSGSTPDTFDLNNLSSHNLLLAQQFCNLKEENRRLKQDVKTSQNASDNFELRCISLQQELEQKQELHRSQMDLMVARVDDLTMKLLNSEKIVRQLRQRVLKLEQRVERRRSSLKGKEALSLSKEYESKLSELEQKIDAVEIALKGFEESPDATLSSQEKEPQIKESNMLMRLHNLDKKVKSVTETVEFTGTEPEVEDFTKPRICLQVKTEDVSNSEACEDWSSLSLSTSMTDLTSSNNFDEGKGKEIALSFHDCLENLNYKIASLVSWLKTNLQLICNGEEHGVSGFSESGAVDKYNGLKNLVNSIDHALNICDKKVMISQDVSRITHNLLYKMVLLQEVTNILFKMSGQEKFKDVLITQHLMRVKQVVSDLEQYIMQKSSAVSINSQKFTLCNIIANLLFCQTPYVTLHSDEPRDVRQLYEEVESSKQKVSSTIFVFKEKFIKNFCSTILELSENSRSDKSCVAGLLEKETGAQPSGQKQFLSHVSNIVSQVSLSFVTHISKSLNETHFLELGAQYSSSWASYICKLLQQDLACLSSEIKSSCVQHFQSDFYSGSKCGVLVEYMHCSIWELAQIVSIKSVVESTVILIKKEIYGSSIEAKFEESVMDCEQMVLSSFHDGILQRATGIMSNLPQYPSLHSSWSFCNTSEINIAHRSVSSLLCFKQKLKVERDNEQKLHQAQIEQLSQRLNVLKEEQNSRQREGCRSCIELGQEVSYLQAELDESRAVEGSGSMCDKCTSLKLEIQKLMEQHERDTFVIQRFEEHEQKWKQQLDEVVKEKEKLFDEEKRKFAAELQSAQQQLKNLENQYDADLNNLQKLRQKKLSQPQSDLWKCKYSTEIDQLKSLCEKGLQVMEITHQKLITELELRHQKELDALVAERDQLLADEARATAVALDAVRTAHKEELQKQMQLFKEDFMKKVHARIETEAFKKGYETEIGNVKHEILAVTEKYSVKCLENISLHESLQAVKEQLKASNSQVTELQSHYKLLRAHLDSDIRQNLDELI